MHRYISYSQEELALLKKCVQIKNRSKSKEMRNDSKSKSIHSIEGLPQQLQATKKISKLMMMEGMYDDNSTKKKGYEQIKVREISDFVIKEQKNEESLAISSNNLKQNASYTQLGEQKINELQKDILGRIDSLKTRLEYRLFVNNRQLMKRPAYGKYINQKITCLKE